MLQKAGGAVQSYFAPPSMGVTELPRVVGGAADGRPYVPPNINADALVRFDALRTSLRRNWWVGLAVGAAGGLAIAQLFKRRR